MLENKLENNCFFFHRVLKSFMIPADVLKYFMKSRS